jgi:hypothetical protein
MGQKWNKRENGGSHTKEFSNTEPAVLTYDTGELTVSANLGKLRRQLGEGTYHLRETCLHYL